MTSITKTLWNHTDDGTVAADGTAIDFQRLHDETGNVQFAWDNAPTGTFTAEVQVRANDTMPWSTLVAISEGIFGGADNLLPMENPIPIFPQMRFVLLTAVTAPQLKCLIVE